MLELKYILTMDLRYGSVNSAVECERRAEFGLCGLHFITPTSTNILLHYFFVSFNMNILLLHHIFSNNNNLYYYYNIMEITNVFRYFTDDRVTILIVVKQYCRMIKWINIYHNRYEQICKNLIFFFKSWTLYG